MDLKDSRRRKVAIVTGAARGIGREIALTLGRKGFAVGVCDTLESVGGTAAEIRALGVPSESAVIDVSAEAEVKQAVATVSANLGPVDVLVNNAGIGRIAPFSDFGVDEWDRTFAVNVRGPFLFIKEVLPMMKERREGLIVNIASVWGLRGVRNRAPYVASKHAVVGLTRALAEECRADRVRAVAICPASVLTDLSRNLPGSKEGWIEPRHVAEVIAFLSGADGQGITDTCIEVTGFGESPGVRAP